MSDREDLWVNGYCFGSLQDAKEARNESQTIAYFKEKTRGRTAGNLLALYDKLLDEKVFKTPVGWEYLKQLQEEILKSDISPDQVRPITLYTGFTYRVQEDAQKAAIRQAEAIAQRKEKKDYRFRVSLCVNFLLAVLVAGMFLITLKSDNPNILNYKQVLTNQYASWEQNLTERENRIREKEQELLGISYPAEEATDTKEE
ncbi:MAG: hypothetical protein HFI46_14525 [Lachnospiraceae bacterium]|jgi:hypothetical protein|nr:hypothetical protein [Lachnospiraceae bacterium]